MKQTALLRLKIWLTMATALFRLPLVLKANRVTKPEAGHFAKAGVEAGRGLWEFRLAEGEEFTVGQDISVELFADVKKLT